MGKSADELPGGRADDRPDSGFDRDQLRQGVKHEREHTKRKAITKEIAKDHLAEDPKYYTHLNKAEKMATPLTDLVARKFTALPYERAGAVAEKGKAIRRLASVGVRPNAKRPFKLPKLDLKGGHTAGDLKDEDRPLVRMLMRAGIA
jgi:hypothetical protein